MEQVISLLFEIVSDTGVFQLVGASKMSLVECMEIAFKVNSNPDVSLIATCVPDLSNPVVIH